VSEQSAPSPSPGELLVIDGVTKRFGGLTAIDELSLTVPELQIHSVIGPNGAGKTTLFNCITGFYTPEEGQMRFGGSESLVHLRPDEISRLGIARTYQNIRVFPELSALENVLIGLHGRLHASLVGVLFNSGGTRREESWALEEAGRLLSFVGLADEADQMAGNLAYGDQRRLEIARAIASEPRLLLLDEPTAGMNLNETAEMIEFIRRLRDDRGITILLIEHDMRVVMTISEQITVMDFGRKIAEGTPAEIQSNPRVIEAYLGRGTE
jgi:branched-chain amino acid transport system ATP-binding protein